MNYRLYKFLQREQHSLDTTIVHDINMQDPVSSIVIGFEALGTQDIMTAHPVACLTKIELVDGSDVLYSLDGYEAEALDWYNNGGKFRSNSPFALTGHSPTRYIGINFGRYLWDPEYAFDPKRFNNPQLRISLDIDGGGAKPTYNYVTGWANLFDEKMPALKGFLMAKEVKEYSIAADTHNYTDLPLDFPYRGLYVRPFVAGTEPNQAISNIKLSEDQDKRIPFDHGAEEILRCIQEDLPPVEEVYYYASGAADRYLYIAPTTRVSATGAHWDAAALARYPVFYNGDGGRLDVNTPGGAGNVQIHVKGYVPHCVYQIPFGIKNDPADWYDVRRLGSLRLDITGASDTAKGFIFLQQERLY